MIDNLSIVVCAFPMHILTSLSVDEILVSKYVNQCTNFRGLPLKVEMAPSYFKFIHVKANAFCCFLQDMSYFVWAGEFVRSARSSA